MPRSCKNYDFQNQEGILPQCALLFSKKTDPLSQTTDKIMNYHYRSFSSIKRKLSKNSSEKGIKLTLSKKKKNQSIHALDSTRKTQAPPKISQEATHNLVQKTNKTQQTSKTLKKLKEGIIKSKSGVLMEENIVVESGQKKSKIGENADLRYLGLLSPNQTTSNSTVKLQTIEEICGSSQYESSLCKLDRCKASVSSLAVEQFKTNYHYIDVYHSEKVSMALIQQIQNPQFQSIQKQHSIKNQKIKQLHAHARDTETILSGSQISQPTFAQDEQIEMSEIISFSKSLFSVKQLKEYRCEN